MKAIAHTRVRMRTPKVARDQLTKVVGKKPQPKGNVVLPKTQAMKDPDEVGRHQGRHDLREDETIGLALEQALLAGNTYKNACILAGINEATFYRWQNEAKSAHPDSIAFKFYEKVKKARATAEHRNVMVIQKAGAKNWTAAAWFLERSNPDGWGRKEKMEVSGDPSSPLLVGQIPAKVLSNEEAMASLAAVLKRAKERAQAQA